MERGKWFFRALLVILLMGLWACDDSPDAVKNIVGNDDDDDNTQTLIINRNSKADPFAEETLLEKSEINNFSRLFITHANHRVPIMTFQDDTGRTHYVGGGRTALANLYTVTDPDPEAVVAVDFGSVELDGITIPMITTDNIRYYLYDDFTGRIPIVYQYHSDSNLDLFTGEARFVTSGGSSVQDLDVELDLPSRNDIVNVNLNETVSSGEDWTIELRKPIYPELAAIQIYERVPKVYTNHYSNRFEGVVHVIIQVTEPTDEVIVPKEELQRLRSESEADNFVLRLIDGIHKVAEIPLYDSENRQFETMDVISMQIGGVQFHLE